MTISGESMGSFGDLGTALGLLDAAGNPNSAWFNDPVGAATAGTGNQHGLRHLLADDDQREALLNFVDEVLGPPDQAERLGQTWLPIFRNATPNVVISAVVQAVSGAVNVGLGVEHATAGGPPRVSTRLHVPLFRLARSGGPALTAEGSLPAWLLLGRVGSHIGITVDATFTEATPAAGEASLGGVSLTVGVPTTTTGDDLSVAFALRNLQLPGATAPRSFDLDASSLAELGTDVFELVIGLVRAQVSALDLNQPALAAVAAVAGLLGLRDDLDDLDPLPLADLPTQGLSALVGWVERVLEDPDALLAWLGQLADLIGGDVDVPRAAVTVTAGPVEVSVGLRVQPGTGGHPTLVPWVELALSPPRSGVKARLSADLLRADTGTGAIKALPDLRIEAVFGRDAGAGATALLAGPDPRVGSLHTGLALDPTGRPAFFLTLHDVTVGGRPHALLDLSTPSAALDSASTVVTGAITEAIGDLGPVGVLINGLLGLQPPTVTNPPTVIDPIDVTHLLADPLAAIRGYWKDLTDTPAAAAIVLGQLRSLLTDAPAASAPGEGTRARPWVVELVSGVELHVLREGDALLAELVGVVTTPVLTDLEATAALGLTLVRADLVTGQATFAVEVRGSLSLARQDGTTAQLELGAVTLEADALAAAVTWAPARGLRAAFTADGLAVAVPALGGERVALPLPSFDSHGQLTLAAPDWTGIEHVLTALLGELQLPPIDALLGLIGWTGGDAHLALADLVGADPGAAVKAWLADLVLDCDNVRFALGPLAALLSGFERTAALGAGTARSPFRAPVTGDPRAPGLAVWLDPGCPPEAGPVTQSLSTLLRAEPPEPATVVGVLRGVASSLPDVADLLVGRDSLAAGLDLLLTRWANTDGIVGQPDALPGLPGEVTAVALEGRSYDELVALGGCGMLVGAVLDAVPTAVVHVGCEATWVTDRPAGTAFDRTVADAAGSLPPTGGGTWFVRLPAPPAAAIARPDRGAVGEQAARLAAVLAGRNDPANPITVIAYGACGAAALRAAATVTAIDKVVTVGTPWGGVAVNSLRTGLGADALRLLDRLRRTGQLAWPDQLFAQQATPLVRVAALVRRCTEFLATNADLPSAGTEARRPGLTTTAVFGNLDRDSLARGLGALVADGVRARVSSATAQPPTEPTALHAGVDVPVMDLDFGGLLLGVGATVELCRIVRATPGPGLDATLARGVIFDVHVGVHDGWLVGGPGAAATSGDLRWLSARIEVPLDGRPGAAELVLHEARGFGVDRERWVVRADPGTDTDATTAVPEVRVLLSAAIARLRSASPDLAALLEQLGLVRAGGLDPDGLDRLLHDTAQTMRSAVAGDPTELATKLRALMPSMTGAGATLSWTVGPATISVDLAAGTLSARLRSTVAGLPPVELDVALTSTGASATAALGRIDEHAGGLRLVARTAPTASLSVEWAGPEATARSVALLPNPDPAGLRDLATVALPAVGIAGLLSSLRQLVSSTAQPALDAALGAVGLLSTPDSVGSRGVVVPVGLVQDPGGWLRHATDAWRTNPAASTVALLDALAPLVVPARGTATGWPIADGVTLLYSVEAGNRLRLVADLAMDIDAGGATVTTSVVAGLLVGADGRAQPTVEASVDVDGRGLRLVLEPGVNPPVRLQLMRAAPAAPLSLYPDGPGLGAALSAAGESVLPIVLNAVAARRNDPTNTVIHDVGQAVFDLGTALDLLDNNQFSGTKITTFAGAPGAQLIARLPQLITTGVGTLAHALDPAGTVVQVTPAPGKVTLGFGNGTDKPVKIVLDASGTVPAIELRANVEIDGVGRFALDRLRLSTAGIDIAARLGPVVIDVGAFSLRPLIVVRAGSAAGSDRMVGIGLALDDAAARSVQFRWGLNAAPPSMVPVTRTTTGEGLGTDAEAAGWLLALALSVAAGVVSEGLDSVLTARAKTMLRGVVFTDAPGAEVDPGLALDLLNPPALINRLARLLWNAATPTTPLRITLGNAVTVALASQPGTTGRKRLGVSVSLAAGQKFTIAEGDTQVDLEVDATWVHPELPAGLSVFVLDAALDTTTGVVTFDLVPSVAIAGLGLRFTSTTGALLSLGPLSLDGIAVHVYAEASPAGAGGGVNLELAGLSFAPGGGGGGNAAANSIMNDAGKASPASRPSFSPAIAVQKHPGIAPSVSVRAGRPPGPWWLVIQRQLGPLYLERVGFDSAETDGRISRISLLFDGRVSMFGLAASVEQLSINWLGGDVLDISSWSVDLMGLAISANMSGVTLVGGMLKTVDTHPGPPPTSTVSYVGMLLGRFGTYGLTVFGGFTNDNGNPSFFVFGGINGPIGGPPCFFLTGIGGGLGINRGLRIPDDVSHFNTFPFIMALDPAARPPADPMQALRDLNTYFPVQRGNFWFAAGISFTCFTLVDCVAVIAVSFGDGFELNLLGLARLALPRPQAALVSIELGLLARFSTREGLFMIRAGLTENSWLLYREVRLTGGFAFVTWWKGALAGQFVMTLGGYHPDFHRDGYPQVPRLGLTWQVTEAIVIKGGMYFALTSEALMVGVELEVSADFGWAWLRIAFGAHGIVYFDPFWYQATAFARISAGVKISTFFGTISFSISLGAQITVHGPEFAGNASAHVGPCSVSAAFGAEEVVEPRTLDWTEFVAKYLEEASAGRARVLSAITGRGTLPSATDGGRSAPTADGTADKPYEVFAEFEVTFVSTVPFGQIDVGLASGQVPVAVTRSDGMGAQLGLKPMRAGNLSSVLHVVLEKYNDTTRAWASMPSNLQQLGANLAAAQPRPEGSAFSRDAYPIGTWGAPDLPGLPAPPLPKGDVVFAGNVVRLVAEATSLSPGPEIDYYRVEASRRPLPLQAGGASRGKLLNNADSVPLTQVTSVGQALSAAATVLFAERAAAPPEGLLRTGQRSALARAAYRGEMSAPPLFGTLADGLARANGADAPAERKPRAGGPAGGKSRPPVVAGYLTSGGGVAKRASGTTVADPRIKRRTAPTLDSVQARVGRELPIQLLRTAPPSVAGAGTLVAAVVPRTVVAGATRSYGPGVPGLVGGLGALPKGGPLPKAAAGPTQPGRRLAAGDVVVVTLPDASVDTFEQRPVLGLDGAARVVILRGDAEVVVDEVRDTALAVPAGAELVAVQADGTVDTGDGLAGWHVRSRVSALGSHAAMAAGCVITTDGGYSTYGVVWTTAAELLAGSAAALTRFSRPVTTVALVMEAGDRDRLDGLELEIAGARRASADGVEVPPTVVLSGGQAVLIFPLEPDGTGPVSVRARFGGDWRITGVLGGDLSVDELSRLVVRRGVVGAAGRVLAGAGKGCVVSWQDAPDPPKKATPKKAGGRRRGR